MPRCGIRIAGGVTSVVACLWLLEKMPRSIYLKRGNRIDSKLVILYSICNGNLEWTFLHSDVVNFQSKYDNADDFYI